MAAQVELPTGEVGRAGVGGRLHLSPLTNSSNKGPVESPSSNQSLILTPGPSKPVLSTKPRLTPKPFALERNTTIKPILAPKPQTRPRPESTRLAGYKPSLPNTPKPLVTGKPKPAPNRPSPTSFKSPAKNPGQTTKPVVQPFKPAPPLDLRDVSKPRPAQRKKPVESNVAYSWSPAKSPAAEWSGTTKNEEEKAQTTSSTSIIRAKSMGFLSHIGQEEEEKEKHRPEATVPLRSQSRGSRPRPVSAIYLESPTKAESPTPAPRWTVRRPLSADLTSKFESIGLSLHRKSADTSTKENTPEDGVQVQRREQDKNPKGTTAQAVEGVAKPAASEQGSNKTESRDKEMDEEKGGVSIKRRISLLLDSSASPGAASTGQGLDLLPPVQPVPEGEPPLGVKQRIKQLTEDIAPNLSPIVKPPLKPRPLPLDLTKRFNSERSADLDSPSPSEVTERSESSKDPQKRIEESMIIPGDQSKTVDMKDSQEQLKQASAFGGCEEGQMFSDASKESGPSRDVHTVRASLFENVIERHSVLMLDDGKTDSTANDVLTMSPKRGDFMDDGSLVTAAYKEPVSPSNSLRVFHSFDTVQAVEENRAVSESIPSAYREDKAMTLRSRHSEGNRPVAERTSAAQREAAVALMSEQQQQQPRYLRVGALHKWTPSDLNQQAATEQGMQRELERDREMALEKESERWREAEQEEAAAAAPKRFKMLQAEEQQKPRATYFALTGQIQEPVSNVDSGADFQDVAVPSDDFSVRPGQWGSPGKVLSARRNPSFEEAFGNVQTHHQGEELSGRGQIPERGLDRQTADEMMEVEKKREPKKETDGQNTRMGELEREKQRQLEKGRQDLLEFARMKEREMQREFERQRQKDFEREKQEMQDAQHALELKRWLEKQKQQELEREYQQQRQEKERESLLELEREKHQQLERERRQEKERERQRELERESLLELEREKHQQLERERRQEKERERQRELERESLLELEREKHQQLERERRQEKERERQRELELETERQQQLERERRLEQEGERQREIERERLLELKIERQQQLERERRQEKERERQREIEREKQHELEIERQCEQQRQRQREQERQRELDKERQLLDNQMERQRQREKERQELEKQRLREKMEKEQAEKFRVMALQQEMERLKELDKEREQRERERLKEIEREKQRELERQRQRELERERQKQLDLDRQEMEHQRLKEMERMQILEFEKQKQAERERQQIAELEKARLRERIEREEAEKMRTVAKQQESERQRLKEKQRKEEHERMMADSLLLKPKVLDLDSVVRDDPFSQATPHRGDPSATRWKQASPRAEEAYKPAILDIDSFLSQTQHSPSKDTLPVSGIQAVGLGDGARLQPHTPEWDISRKPAPQTSVGLSVPMWAPSPQDPWDLSPGEASVDTPAAAPEPPRKHGNKVSVEQLLLRQGARLLAPERRRSGMPDETFNLAPFPGTEAKVGSPPGRVSGSTSMEQLWLPRDPEPRNNTREVLTPRRLPASQLNRMRSRSVSRRSAPSKIDVEGSLSRMRSRSAHREEDLQNWVQSGGGEEEGKDSDSPIRDTDSQYGTWDTGLRTDDSLTPATPSSDSNLSPSPRKPTTPHTPGAHTSPMYQDSLDGLGPSTPPENQLLPFPDAPTALLDTSALRSRAQLGKKRAPRSRPSRAARQTLLTEAEGGATEDWRYRDSTEEKFESKKESDSEEQVRGADGGPAATSSQPQRVPLFPGIDPSALKAQLKRRGDSDHQTDGAAPTSSQLSHAPKSPFLPHAARVLPPPGGKENGGEEKSPQWLKELKSKKRLSQYENEN
ncbi:uncharacterized protein LOC143011701 isoform X2 [Genypterus blacodes]|uniref:uncharacterized protein LOC143011701 isoform X2 n=1 Tax=Genypterus blacodes TaxID=154954 RepID=UPI003F769DFF